MKHGPWRRGLLAWSMLVMAACGAPEPRDPAEGARVIESRLLAPCCWVQTLDVHESELSTSLRSEIKARLRSGETSEGIEDAFAARYGERIRAVPKGRDPRGVLPAALGVVMALSLLGLVRMLRRWAKRAKEDTSADLGAPRLDATAAATKDAYDGRIDDELARLDDG